MTCLVVAMYQDNAQVGWLQPAPILYCHIVPLADVVDVDRDAGIRTWKAETNMCKTVLHCHYFPVADETRDIRGDKKRQN